MTKKFSGERNFNRFLVFVLVFLLGINFLGWRTTNLDRQGAQISSFNDLANSDPAGVLGSDISQPRINISGEEYGRGGVIALPSTAEPKISISSYRLSGNAEVSLYKADLSRMLTYLLHDADGKQINQNVEVKEEELVTRTSFDLTASYNEPAELSLPLDDTGVWYMKIKVGDIQDDAFIIRSKTGVTVREAEAQTIFWGQDLPSKQRITDGSLTLYNLENKVSTVSSVIFNGEGIATTSVSGNADIAIATRGEDIALIPMNLTYLNYSYGSYKSFAPQEIAYKFFVFTDRPLYAPGDTINFKSIIRRDNDGVYTLSGGVARAGLYLGWGQDRKVIAQQDISVSGEGTVDGSFSIPEDASAGSYYVEIDMEPGTERYGAKSTTYVQIEYFRKPDYSIDVEISKREYIAGDKPTLTITGNYFFGQPLSGGKVSYKVYSSNFYEYNYLSSYQREISDDYRYGYWGGGVVAEGETTLNEYGRADVSFETRSDTGTKVLSIEATYQDESGNPSFARKNILLYPGEYGMYFEKYIWGKGVNDEYDIPLIIESHNSTNVAGKKVTGSVTLTTWKEYTDENYKYPQYRREEKEIGTLEGITDENGKVTFKQKPTEAGSYNFLFEIEDSRGNKIKKDFDIYVSDGDGYYYSDTYESVLSLNTDRDLYDYNDTVKLTIFSEIPDRDVFLSFDRGYVHRYRVVHVTGNKTVVEEKLQESDIPNIYAVAESFSDVAHNLASAKVTVSTDSKVMSVQITPDKSEYKPGDRATINIQTTDIAGNPVSSDTAFWAVDKAIFELVDEPPLDVFDKFWSERYLLTSWSHSLLGINVEPAAEQGGGCFDGETLIDMADGGKKAISQIKDGDKVLTKNEDGGDLATGVVVNAHSKEVTGYLIVNGDLRVTPEHIMYINGQWATASTIETGDLLTSENGKEVMVNSVEWLAGKKIVYNFDVKNYHTFFANGYWVHNQKGSPRTSFEDTAYWNAHVRTDANGFAQVSFILPDNLTTWILASVGATNDTKVGKSTNEIVVSKDVVVRPILPNILRTGDTAIISAVVQNFRKDESEFDIGLKTGGLTLESESSTIERIGSKGIKQYFWKVKAENEGEAELTFSAIDSSDENIGDVVVVKLPVREFGFIDTYGLVGENDKVYNLDLASDSSEERSSITLNLSPTLIGSLPQAMDYLVGYPYGCVEQTTSRFVPAVIAKANPNIFDQTLQEKNVDEYIEIGIKRLKDQQGSDGGWSWWGRDKSTPFITSYVTEYLLRARQLGYNVDEGVFDKAKNYLNNSNFSDNSEKVAKIYTLSFLGDDGGKEKIENFDGLAPDVLALAVMANTRNGVSDVDKSGLAKLLAMSKTQGEGLYWGEGNTRYFGSIDASTALSLRALVASGKNIEASKAARYLLSSRKTFYWSNTFGTAQVVQAAVDLVNANNELTPDLNYEVKLDGENLSGGKIRDSKLGSVDINIPVNSVKAEGSLLNISKSGEGQLYSSLAVSEFRTDRNVGAVSNGLSITRSYINKTKPGYSYGVGDTVEVTLTVEGLANSIPYGVVEDRLPAGMIPVNTRFENEQANQVGGGYQYFANKEYLEDGVIISLYELQPGKHEYKYLARVISEGDYTIPPAKVSLMYSPEIYGRSAVEQVSIEREGRLLPGRTMENTFRNIQNFAASKTTLLLLFIGFVLLVTVLGYLIRKRRKEGENKTNEQEDPPMAPPATI